MVYDPSGGHLTHVYLDGSKVVSLSRQLSTLTGVIQFGHNGFKGKMDDIRIYNHALSSDEVTGLVTGLVGKWDFNGNLNNALSTHDPFTVESGSGSVTYTTDYFGAAGRAVHFASNAWARTNSPAGTPIPLLNSERT